MNVTNINIKTESTTFPIYIEYFDLNNIEIDEKSYKNVLIYYIGYETIKKA